jgi:hypothetical protein
LPTPNLPSLYLFHQSFPLNTLYDSILSIAYHSSFYSLMIILCLFYNCLLCNSVLCFLPFSSKCSFYPLCNLIYLIINQKLYLFLKDDLALINRNGIIFHLIGNNPCFLFILIKKIAYDYDQQKKDIYYSYT